MPRNGKTQSQASGGTASHGFGLTETVEDIRKKLRADSSSSIFYSESCFDSNILQLDSNVAPRRCKLHGIGQQVPHNLLKPMWIAQDRSAFHNSALQSNAFGFGGRPDGIERGFYSFRESHRLQ